LGFPVRKQTNRQDSGCGFIGWSQTVNRITLIIVKWCKFSSINLTLILTMPVNHAAATLSSWSLRERKGTDRY